MQAIILSGGLGTRLHPLTLEVPKPMLPIGGIPHLEYQIRLLRKHGIKDIIFSTGYLHKEIEKHFGRGRECLNRFNVWIQYKEDGEILLGTGGALKNCEELIDEEEILVLNGDILTNINLSAMKDFHRMKRAPISMALYPVDNPSQFGVAVRGSSKADTDKIIEFVEKPTDPKYGNYINAGIYMMNKAVLYSIDSGQHSMLEKDLFPKFAEAGMLHGFIDAEMKWLDIGTLERYSYAQLLCQKLFL